MTFQTTVNITQAVAVEGDFASATLANHSVLATPGGFIAGPNGLVVGRFCWADVANNQLLSNTGGGAPTGFVHRSMNALITTYLTTTGMTIPAGFNVGEIFNAGDFWVKNGGTNEVLVGMKAYANNATGIVTFGATATPPSDFSMTGAVTAGAGSATTSTIVDNVFTITTLASGNFYPGTLLTGTNVAAGSVIVRQLTGAVGGATGATFLVSPGGQAVTSTTITGAYGILTVTAATTGTVHVGDTVAGGTIVAGTQVTALGTGTGGLGTYFLNNATTATSGTVTGTSATETKWYAMSQANSGELVKMSSFANG